VSDVKSRGSPLEVHPKLRGLSLGWVTGTHGVAVKCVDIMWNTGGESESLEQN
jgi:hypothetical protein